jgi:hypothetical protein
MIENIIADNTDISFQLSLTSDNLNGLPNQTLMSVFLRYLSERVKKYVKIYVLSSEIKLLNMVRYEIVKLENYTVNVDLQLE